MCSLGETALQCVHLGKMHCSVCSLGEEALQCVHLGKRHCDVFSEGNVLHYNAFLAVVKAFVGWVGA